MSRGRLSPTVLLLASLGLLLGAAGRSASTAPIARAQGTDVRVTVAGIREHLAALQKIADENGGNRMAGTPGYEASTRYVAERMRRAGYRVRFQEFAFPFVVDRSPPTLRAVGAGDWSYRSGRDYRTLLYSGSGRVEAEVVAVDLLVPSPRPNASTSACEPSDFAAFPRGAVALVQRGACVFREKVENAVAAGASAVIVFNEGNPGRRSVFAATLAPPQARIPAIAASFALGNDLRSRVRAGTKPKITLTADMVAERRRTRNVIADSRAGRVDNVVVVGAHLDGVQEGPGINDNGSGSALILEVAEELANVRTANRLRFVWWGAEELGLIGSRHYVSRLSAAARQRIALYLNFDMVGSPNFVTFVYDGDGSASPGGRSFPPGSDAVERVFARYFASRRLPHREAAFGGNSDHAPFARAGIPVGGLFTGADGQKSPAQADAFGGRAGRPFDPCYHRRCDSLANVSDEALSRTAGAAAHAIALFAQDTSSVRRAG